MSIDWDRVYKTGTKMVRAATKSVVNQGINTYDHMLRDGRYTEEEKNSFREKRDELKKKRDMFFND